MDILSKHQEINELLSLYKSLLTDKQQLMLGYYYEDDYSLSEIAAILNVSRNAIYDQLNKAVEKMMQFEQHLQLRTQRHHRDTVLEKLQGTKLTSEQVQLIEDLKKVI